MEVGVTFEAGFPVLDMVWPLLLLVVFPCPNDAHKRIQPPERLN